MNSAFKTVYLLAVNRASHLLTCTYLSAFLLIISNKPPVINPGPFFKHTRKE
jgi:hypothetical protein